MTFVEKIRRPFARLRTLYPALSHRNYRLFFFGQGVSLTGTWMQRIALGWLVYRLTSSEWLLGVVGFSSQILTFALAPLAGVLADRADRLRLVIATQSVAMVQAFILAALTLTNTITVWEIIALSAVLGLINAFDIPIRQSFVVEMLETREHLPNAIALNSFLINGAKLIGPPIAGVFISLFGEGTCFLLNALSFVAVIGALLAMRVTRTNNHAAKSGVIQHMKEGLLYSYHCLSIRAVLLLLAFLSLVSMSIMVLMPVFARDVLHGGPSTLGFLMTWSGLGAITGAVFMAARNRARGLGRLIATGAALLGLALLGFSSAQTLPHAFLFITLVGFATMILLASCNTFLQSRVDDDKRGRVMSLYTMSFMGMAPFGSLLAGALAERLGAPWTATIGGIGSLLAAGVFALYLPRLDMDLFPPQETVETQPGVVLGENTEQ